MAKLGEIIFEYSVRNNKKENLPVLSVTNSKGFCSEYFSKEIASKDKSKYKIVPKGYFAYNPSRINVGSIDYQKNYEKVIVSPLYEVFGVTEQVSQQYLLYYLKSDISLTYIKGYAKGSVRDTLKLSELMNFNIPLPPLEEQQKIAAVLDKITDLIGKRKQQLAKLDELIKSRFVEMFGDPVTNSYNWKLIKLSELGSFKNGMNFNINDKGVQIHCLGVGDFKDLSVITDTSILPIISLNKIPPQEYLLQNGDIIFVRSNGNKLLVGRSIAIYPNNIPTTFSGFCIRFRLNSDKLKLDYLLRVFKNNSFRQKMVGRGANIQNLNQKILSNLQIPIPPIDLQNQFAEFVEQTEKTKVAINRSLDELETLKKALMQKYFG